MHKVLNRDRTVGRKLIYGLRQLLSAILIGIIWAVIIGKFIVLNGIVPTRSMMPTLEVGDRIIVNRLAYVLSTPQRGDLAVFKVDDMLVVKRVAGLPGDWINQSEGKVLSGDSTVPADSTWIQVPKEGYFMLGDNSEESIDSRYWKDPFVKLKNIKGKVLFRYYDSFKWVS